MRPTAEDLVDASSRWLHGQAFGAAGPAYVNFNKDTWEKSKAWDFAQSNHQAIWDAELEKEPLKEAAVVAKTDPERAFRIWSMLADGSQARQLTSAGHNESPNWSPR